ncbi:hypothetical protein GZH46_02138, partial [Fragariocoptes setiger]
AKGWPITRSEIPSRNAFIIFLLLCALSDLVLNMWTMQFSGHDAYHSLPKRLGLVLRAVIMVYFLLELRSTMILEQEQKKLKFYLHFGALSMVWFVHPQIVYLIALRVSNEWQQRLLTALFIWFDDICGSNDDNELQQQQQWLVDPKAINYYLVDWLAARDRNERRLLLHYMFGLALLCCVWYTLWNGHVLPLALNRSATSALRPLYVTRPIIEHTCNHNSEQCTNTSSNYDYYNNNGNKKVLKIFTSLLDEQHRLDGYRHTLHRCLHVSALLFSIQIMLTCLSIYMFVLREPNQGYYCAISHTDTDYYADDEMNGHDNSERSSSSSGNMAVPIASDRWRTNTVTYVVGAIELTLFSAEIGCIVHSVFALIVAYYTVIWRATRVCRDALELLRARITSIASIDNHDKTDSMNIHKENGTKKIEQRFTSEWLNVESRAARRAVVTLFELVERVAPFVSHANTQMACQSLVSLVLVPVMNTTDTHNDSSLNIVHVLRYLFVIHVLQCIICLALAANINSGMDAIYRQVIWLLARDPLTQSAQAWLKIIDNYFDGTRRQRHYKLRLGSYQLDWAFFSEYIFLVNIVHLKALSDALRMIAIVCCLYEYCSPSRNDNEALTVRLASRRKTQETFYASLTIHSDEPNKDVRSVENR